MESIDSLNSIDSPTHSTSSIYLTHNDSHRLTDSLDFLNIFDSQWHTDSLDSHRLTPTHSTHNIFDSQWLTRLPAIYSTHNDSHRLTSTHIDSHRLTSTHIDSHRLTPTHIDSHRLTSTHSTHNDSHRLTSLISIRQLTHSELHFHFIRNYSHLFYLSYFILIFILFWIYSGWNICRLKGHSTHINSNRIVYFPRFSLSYSAERTQTNCFSQPNQI